MAAVSEFLSEPDRFLGLSPEEPLISWVFGPFSLEPEEDDTSVFAHLPDLGIELEFDEQEEDGLCLITVFVYVSSAAAEDAGHQTYSGRLPSLLQPCSTKSDVKRLLGDPLSIREERSNTIVGFLPGAFTYPTQAQNRFQVEFKGDGIYRLVYWKDNP